MTEKKIISEPGRESLNYTPAKVSWATAQFVQQPPPIVYRFFIYMLVVFLVTASIYSYYSEIPISIDAHGVLISDKPVLPLRALDNLTVSQLKVQNNQHVEQGQVLVESQDQLSHEKFQTLLKQIKDVSELLDDDSKGQCKKCRNKLKSLSRTAFSGDTQGRVRELVAPVQELLRDLVSAYSSRGTLKDTTKDMQRRIKLARKKLKEIRRRGAQEILAVEVEQLRTEIVSAQAQLADRTQTAKSSIEQARNRLDVRMMGLAAALEKYQSAQILKAPIAGIVTELKISGAGQFLTAGQEIMSLVPVDSTLVAELAIANRDISQVKQGMSVKLKLDALPEREYGSVNGIVESVPISIGAGGNANDTSYKVRVTLDKQSLQKSEIEYQFRMGMTLRGMIVTRTDSLLMLGVKRLLRLKDNFFEESGVSQ